MVVGVSVGLAAASRLGSTLSAPKTRGTWQPASLLSSPHLCVVVDAANTLQAEREEDAATRQVRRAEDLGDLRHNAGALQGVRLLTGPPGAGEPDAQAWAPDGTVFVVAYGQTVVVFAGDRHHPVAASTLEHQWPAQGRNLIMRQRIRDLACSRALSSNLTWIAAAGDHGVKVFDVQQALSPIYLVQSFSVSVVAFYQDKLLVGTTDGHLGIWNLSGMSGAAHGDSSPGYDARWRKHVDISGRFTSAEFSEDGSYFAVASWRDGIFIFARDSPDSDSFSLQKHILSAGPHKTLQHAALLCFAPHAADAETTQTEPKATILAYTTEENKRVIFYDVQSHQEIDMWDNLGDVVTGMAGSCGSLLVHTLQGGLRARMWPTKSCMADADPPLPHVTELPEAVAHDINENRVLRHIHLEGIRVILVEGCAHVCFVAQNKWKALITRASAVGILPGPTLVFAGSERKARGLEVDLATCALRPLAGLEISTQVSGLTQEVQGPKSPSKVLAAAATSRQLVSEMTPSTPKRIVATSATTANVLNISHAVLFRVSLPTMQVLQD